MHFCNGSDMNMKEVNVYYISLLLKVFGKLGCSLFDIVEVWIVLFEGCNIFVIIAACTYIRKKFLL